jgi:hypothetical protein
MHMKTKNPHCSRRKAAASPSQLTTRRFKVHAQIDIPLAAVVTVNARGPQEADELVQLLLHESCSAVRLQRLMKIQTISGMAKDNAQVGIKLRSEVSPEILVWDTIDLASGNHCGPYVQLA